MPTPLRIHVVGRKNHGKTTFLCELVTHLKAQGLRVGTIKHTHHEHELDLPGKDSYLHRKAGAFPAAIVSRSSSAVFWDVVRSDEESERYAHLACVFDGCDVVLVEGDQATRAPKIEVWRKAVGTPPLAASDPSIRLVVSDDDPACACPVLPRRDIGEVARRVRAWIGKEGSAEEAP